MYVEHKRSVTMPDDNRFMSGRLSSYIFALYRPPQAIANIYGDDAHPNLNGQARFFQTPYGILISLEASNLPNFADPCKAPIFAVHIHDGNSCTGDDFSDTLSHYNPDGCQHPHHAGDMPPLFGNNGYAFEIFLTNRFTVAEVLGKTVVIHENPDDFTTQPSGNSGAKIACGVIVPR